VFAEYKEYKGAMTYWANSPKEAKKGFPVKDWNSPKRIAALESALKYTELMVDKSKMSAENVIVLAEKFLTFLNK
jgi:hypothetical protein